MEVNLPFLPPGLDKLDLLPLCFPFCSGTISLSLSFSLCFFLSLLTSFAVHFLSPSFPFSQPFTIDPFMWPHFETWRGGLEGTRGDSRREGGGGGQGRERGGRRCKGSWEVQRRKEAGVGRPELHSPFFSLQLFYESRNIIFSSHALPQHDPRAGLRRLKCHSP